MRINFGGFREMRKQIAIIGTTLLFCMIIISGCSEQKNPVISSFEAIPDEIELGQESQLRWNVVDATSITIDNGIGNVNLTGNKTITPIETTTYTMTAKSASNTVTASVQIIVIESSEKPNISMAQSEFYIEISDTNNSRLNQSRVFIIAINENTGENQTSALGPSITDGDGNPKILGVGDAITFRNLSDFQVGELWTIQMFYKGEMIGQCIFKNPKGPYDTPIVHIIQSRSSVTIIRIINGPLEQTSCSVVAINTTSGTNQTNAIGATIVDGDNNPTLLGIGDQIIFKNLDNFQIGDQWTIHLLYQEDIIGQCSFTNQGSIILIPT